MISINLSTIDFNGNGGGGGTPSKLQDKTVGITSNGISEVLPDDGFDGIAKVIINTSITGDTSAIDFSIIGYDSNLSAEINAQFNADVAYSKTLYDAWNPSKTSTKRLYQGDTKLVYAPNIDTSNVTNMYMMFKSCANLTSVPLLITSNVTDMSYMFGDCTSLTSVPLFDTSKVTNMSYMFSYCSRLTTVPALDTSKVTNMLYMFGDCTSLTSVPLFDTSKVTNMQSMFQSCTSLTTIPEFDTSNVTDMSSMFSNCSRLTTVPALDTSNVNNVNSTFSNCSSLTTVPAFDTSKVTNMSSMFSNCSRLTTVPQFNTSNVTSMNSMFSNCSSLTTIEGISFKSYRTSTMAANYLVGFSTNTSIRKAVFKDIGYNSNAKQFNTSYIANWGVNSDEILDARQSLIDSLITYSFDRATAGYSTCTITLSTKTKALLTEDEIVQITNKGYTIV